MLFRFDNKSKQTNTLWYVRLEENKDELERSKLGKTEGAAKRTVKCRQCGGLGHNSMSDTCPVNQANPDFKAKKEASKANKRGNKKVQERSKEFKQDDVRRTVGGGPGGPGGGGAGGGSGGGPSGVTSGGAVGSHEGASGFKVKLNLNASG